MPAAALTARPARGYLTRPMPHRRVLFYVSGHGFGHARRAARVIAALRAVAPDIDVRVRTAAPARLFDGAVPPGDVAPCDVDAGAAERSPLAVDADGTLDRIATVLGLRDQIVTAELAAMRDWRPGMIVADIPFLAGDVAAAAGVPCVGMSNFTWDWIAEPFVAARPDRRPLLDAVRRSYATMTAILRLPLGGVSDAFRQVVEVPLVANRATRDPADVLRALGIDAKDDRPRALFGVRGAVPTATLAAAARAADDILLLCPAAAPGDVPPGVVPVALGTATGLDFSDVLAACDVVVGKMGYGLVAECIASGTALLWPRRTGFREDDVVERDGPRVMRMRELPLPDFQAGRWAEDIKAAAALPAPPDTMRTDGAETCARWIAGHP